MAEIQSEETAESNDVAEEAVKTENIEDFTDSIDEASEIVEEMVEETNVTVEETVTSATETNDDGEAEASAPVESAEIENSTEKEDNKKKKGFFGRLFGR